MSLSYLVQMLLEDVPKSVHVILERVVWLRLEQLWCVVVQAARAKMQGRFLGVNMQRIPKAHIVISNRVEASFQRSNLCQTIRFTKVSDKVPTRWNDLASVHHEMLSRNVADRCQPR